MNAIKCVFISFFSCFIQLIKTQQFYSTCISAGYVWYRWTWGMFVKKNFTTIENAGVCLIFVWLDCVCFSVCDSVFLHSFLSVLVLLVLLPPAFHLSFIVSMFTLKIYSNVTVCCTIYKQPTHLLTWGIRRVLLMGSVRPIGRPSFETWHSARFWWPPDMMQVCLTFIKFQGHSRIEFK